MAARSRRRKVNPLPLGKPLRGCPWIESVAHGSVGPDSHLRPSKFKFAAGQHNTVGEFLNFENCRTNSPETPARADASQTPISESIGAPALANAF